MSIEGVIALVIVVALIAHRIGWHQGRQFKPPPEGYDLGGDITR
jgi:hypothetical protein